ncbi:MAG TPA: FAD:protein FMN transferase [Jatrophihabitans sp.]|jgi:thiamine biosynthesis lipoprotein|nr:FAD:protein FMN transferase [Jatrophihabitans sp.]
MSATYTGSAWSSTVRLVVDDDRVLRAATQDLTALLARIDAAASRFRSDSTLSIANRRAGRPTPVPKILVDLVGAALDAAEQTAGAVDPTLGLAMHRIGYDRDIRSVTAAAAQPPVACRPVRNSPRPDVWRAVRLHREAGLLTVPPGVALDLGATAKAWTADHAARALAARYDTAVLVELGGDLAVAGDRPDGWVVQVAEREGAAGQLVLVRDGGLATSTTTVRTWRRGGRRMHHIVDPDSGLPADGPWRTASVAAPSAYAANVASTAAIVRGDDAFEWLAGRGLAARLVARDGAVTTTPGWPRVQLAMAVVP